MITSEKVDKVLPALAKVKSKLQAVTKKANNPFFKSKYADLNTYLDEVEPLLEENGLLLLQPTCHDASGNTVITRIYHVESGQYVEASMKLVGDADMQKSGSGVTYARRYTLGALLSMKAEDDDGNVASGKTYSKPAAPKVENKKVEEKPQVKTEAAPTPVEEAKPANRPSFRRPQKAAETKVEEVAPVSNGDDL